MSDKVPNPDHLAWIKQWKSASVALGEHSSNELRQMTEKQCRQAIERIFEHADNIILDPNRASTSGLIEQQKYFMRWRLGQK